VATPAELTALSSPYRRFGAQWNGYVRGGFGTARAVGRLHRGQATLAMILLSGDSAARPSAGPVDGAAAPDELSAARTAILTARKQLAAAGLPEAAGPDLYRGPSGTGWAALVAGFAGLVGLQMIFGLNAGGWGAGALLLVALLVAGLGGAALLLTARGVRRARAARVPADTRLGVAALPGITSVLLGLVLITAALGLLVI